MAQAMPHRDLQHWNQEAFKRNRGVAGVVIGLGRGGVNSAAVNFSIWEVDYGERAKWPDAINSGRLSLPRTVSC